MVELAKIIVHKTTGHCLLRRRIPARAKKSCCVSVEFDDPVWDGLVKTVVFRGNGKKIAEFDGEIAIVPWEVLENPGPPLWFGIWGSDPDTGLQLPLIEVRIGTIEESTDPDADPGTDPTLPIWAQLKQDVEELKKGGTGGAQSDWNAAEGEPGHVLNRTHWTERNNVELPVSGFWTEGTIDEVPMFYVTAPLGLELGKTYIVNWGGVEYSVVGRDLRTVLNGSFGAGVFIGNQSWATGEDNTGEPFVVAALDDPEAADGMHGVVIPQHGQNNTEFHIYGDVEIVHKLDNKYLNLDWIPIRVENEVIPKQRVTTVAITGASAYMCEIPDTVGLYDTLEVGQTVMLYVNGKSYKATVSKDLDGKSIAEYGYIADPTDTQTPPFVDGKWLIQIQSSRSSAWFSATKPGTYTVRVTTADGNTNKIPEDFLPDDIGAVKTVNGVAPDENGNVEITIPDSGGNVDYTVLENKPKINGVELSGNKSLEDLGIGQPTDEQIGNAVSAWLDEHPEATATVQNGSITEEKLSDSVIKRIDGNAVFAGKTASFYGDSLTEVNSHYTKGYHSWLKDLLGLASYNNYGVSGYKVSNVYNKVNSVTDTADIVFVMCGVNDQTFSVPLGTMGDTTTDTTYGSLNMLCSLLKQKYPTSIILFITPHYQTKYPHSAGITSYEVAKAVREVCEKYAIPVYDNYALSGIYSTNLSVFTTDNCHWNDNGHEMVGKNLAKFVTDSFRYVYGNAGGGGSGDSGNEDEEDTTVSVTGVSLNVSSGTLTVGESVTLIATVLPSNATNKNVAWKSSAENIATVSDGVIYAVSEGSVTITATTEDGGFKASYELTVNAAESEDSYINGAKTLEITGQKIAGQWHISLYVRAKDLPTINNENVTYGFTIEPISDYAVYAMRTGGIYCVDTVNDLLAGYSETVLHKTATVKDNGNGTYDVSMEHTMTKTANKQYWLFASAMAQNIGDKFTVSNVYVNVGAQSYPICAIGGAFKEETCTVT